MFDRLQKPRKFNIRGHSGIFLAHPDRNSFRAASTRPTSIGPPARSWTCSRRGDSSRRRTAATPRRHPAATRPMCPGCPLTRCPRPERRHDSGIAISRLRSCRDVMPLDSAMILNRGVGVLRQDRDDVLGLLANDPDDAVGLQAGGDLTWVRFDMPNNLGAGGTPFNLRPRRVPKVPQASARRAREQRKADVCWRARRDSNSRPPNSKLEGLRLPVFSGVPRKHQNA